ncbi:MAG: hypothetical protein ACE5ES_06350 [Candidatus Nanoarchaeia archaeon]
MGRMERGDIIGNNIKDFLKDGPASINDICKGLKISWATAKSALEDMKEKENVKEILSSKIRIFKLSEDPAFYGVPLTNQQKNDALFLFETIKKEWIKKNEKPLLKTTLQKIAVDVAKKCDCDIPVVQFHYGLVVPIVASPSLSLTTPKNKDKIILTVREIIPLHSNHYKDEIDKQYENYGLTLFQEKQKIVSLLKNCDHKLDKETIKKRFSKFLLICPTDNKDIQIFSLCSSFVDKIHGLILTNDFENNLENVKDSFNILWDFLTTYLFFKDVSPYVKKGKKEIFEYIKSFQLLSKKSNVEERINYLDSLTEVTKEIKLPEDEESIAIRRILNEGAEEE